MKAYELRKELYGLTAKIEGRGPDVERLRALDRVFEICNQCSTRSERRTFYDVIPQKKIPHLAKLAVERRTDFSGWMPEIRCGPTFEKLTKRLRHCSDWPWLVLLFDLGFPARLETLASIAKDQDYGFETRGLALKCLQEVRNACERRASLDEFKNVISNFRLDGIKLGLVYCAECGRYNDLQRCRCGCARQLCRRCAGIDSTTNLILKELSRI